MKRRNAIASLFDAVALFQDCFGRFGVPLPLSKGGSLARLLHDNTSSKLFCGMLRLSHDQAFRPRFAASFKITEGSLATG
jgi:hypothetical protein